MVGMITNDIRILLLFVDVQCVQSQLHCTLTNVFNWCSSECNSSVLWLRDLWALYWSVNRTRSDNVGGGDTLQTGKQASTTSDFTVSTHIATTLLSPAAYQFEVLITQILTLLHNIQLQPGNCGKSSAVKIKWNHITVSTLSLCNHHKIAFSCRLRLTETSHSHIRIM